MSCCSSKNYEYQNIGLQKDLARKHDYEFKGPVSKRSCTDILCCIIFFIFLAGLVFISIWAFIFGDVHKLIHPTNSKGELCGHSSAVRNKTKLIFFNLFDCIKMGPALISLGCPTKQICSSSCPTMFWSLQMNTGRQNMVCEGDKNGNDIPFKLMKIPDLIHDRLCAEYVFPSKSVINRCIPNFFELEQIFKINSTGNILEETNILNNIRQNKNYFDITEVLTKLFVDFLIWYKPVCVFFGLAFVISMIYLLFLRYFAQIIVWFTIILFVLIFATGATICFFTYYLIQQQYLANKYFSWYTLVKLLNDKFWLGMGISISIILIILIIILIFLRNQIKISIAILTSTSSGLSYLMDLFLWPLFLFVIQMVVLCGSVIVIILLSTIRDSEGISSDLSGFSNFSSSDMRLNLKIMLHNIPCVPGVDSTSQKICTFIKYGSKTYIYIFILYTLFMFFWIINFIKALGQITIAGSFASYYFSFKKPDDIPQFPAVLSFWRAIRYHLGSLAFGSLILAIVQLIRTILEFLDHKAKSSQNILILFVLKCLKCCFWCLERIVKFITKNAYIMIAIYGQNYCSAAKNAFHLLSRNMIRVFVVDKVTDFVLLMGKLVVVGIFGVLSFVYFNGIILKSMTKFLYYYYVPVIVTIVGTFIISSLILQIFELGVETIFLCFCEDLERNDGSQQKPYFMTKGLTKILMKYNRESFEMKEREREQA